MDRRIHNSEWIHVLRPLSALEPAVAECPPSPPNSRSWLGAHKSAHHWRWAPDSGPKSRGFNIRMGLMGRGAIMSCSEQDSICRENCYGVFGLADMRHLGNVPLNAFLAKEMFPTIWILALDLKERNRTLRRNDDF
ncbi:hypothetical protein CDAR_454241 [Caerostris darwini]|uniref:Uncharacterized protein n=1 Tax=Caerostris darwini TaxID=1538125 RepID=A0AAV4V7X0_9ARAC|nr:hypothetical protein CDAR_454241 [Caerostris darwini]